MRFQHFLARLIDVVPRGLLSSSTAIGDRAGRRCSEEGEMSR